MSLIKQMLVKYSYSPQKISTPTSRTSKLRPFTNTTIPNNSPQHQAAQGQLKTNYVKAIYSLETSVSRFT